jgi:preprotein translocase subunit SecD
VIHAIQAKPESPPPSASPVPQSDPAKAIADEKQLRQNTDQQIQLLGLQFQATRCDQDDALTGLDDPNLPLITCSADGEVVYLLDRSIIGGDQIRNATSGRDPPRGFGATRPARGSDSSYAASILRRRS